MGSDMDAVIDQAPAKGSALVAALVSTKKFEDPPFEMPSSITQNYLDDLLKHCVANKVSDLILASDDYMAIKAGGGFQRITGERPLYTEELNVLLGTMLNDPNASLEIERAQPRDFAYVVKLDHVENLRFRCCATGMLTTGGRNGIELIFRPTKKPIPTLEALGIEPYIIENSQPESGIVIVTGPTGHGKSTLIDSMLRRNLTGYPARRIVAFYSPIENDLNDNIPDMTGQYIPSEIGRAGFGAHLLTYEAAIRNMLRRNPDQVVLGEARDQATINGAVMSAVSGHLTYTTTHTPSVHMTIPRMVDEFPPADRIRITNSLIDNCRLIVHQRLLPHVNGIAQVGIRSALATTQDIRNEMLRSPIDRLPLLMKELTKKHGIDLLDSAQKRYDCGDISDGTLAALERELKGEFLG